MLARRFVTLFALFALSTVVACGGPEARKAQSLAAGQQFLDEGNLDKARVELRNVLQIDPNDVEARYLSGVIAERQAKIRQAAGHYKSTIDIDATHIRARAGLAKIHVMASLPSEAIRIVNEGIDSAQPPTRAALLAVRGAAYATLGESASAHQDAVDALQDDPHNEQAIALLAGVLRGMGDGEGAISVLDDGIEKLPETADLRVARAELARESGDIEIEGKLYEDLVGRYPEVAAYRYRRSLFLQRTGDLEAAEAELRAAIEVEEDADRGRLVLVNFLAEAFGFEAAERELQALVAEEVPGAGLLLGEFYATNQRPQQALAAYEATAEKAPDSADGYTARSRIAAYYIDTGRRAEGVSMLEDVLAENPRDEAALRTRATLALAESRPDDAIIDFRALLRDNPESDRDHVALAQAYLRKGDMVLAEESLRNAVQAQPNNIDNRVRLAELLGKTGKSELADELIRSVLISNGTHYSAHEIGFRIVASRSDWATAEERARSFVELYPKEVTPHYLLGLSLEGQGDAAAAVEAYEAALALDEKAAEPLAAWARIKAEGGQHAEALERLMAVREAHPEIPLLGNLYAELLIASGEFEQARGVIEETIALQPGWWMPYRTLSRSHVDLQGEDSIAALRRGYEATGAVELGVELAARLEQQTAFADAIDVYESMIARQGATALLANNLAMLLATHRDDEASLARAVELTESFATSDNASLLNTFGWVRLQSGDVDTALPVLQEAVKLSPESAIMRYHLGMAFFEKGNTVAAREELQRALDLTSSFPGADEARDTLLKLSQATANQVG